MLDISRLDADDLEINLSTCNLSELIRKIAAEYFLILDDQGYSFEVDISEDELYVNIDAALIERAIRNLLDNAIRYGKDGNFLGIELVEDEQSVCIMVKDKGKGVTLEEQERIFERFYRVDSGRKGEGLGIGLSIVKDIVKAHQGSVQMTSIPYVETVFQVRLPKKG
jgi:signal transduction histidine kinase